MRNLHPKTRCLLVWVFINSFLSVNAQSPETFSFDTIESKITKLTTIPYPKELPSVEYYNSYNFTQVLCDEWKPHNFVRSLIVDKRGYLWAGSDKGLTCFDGFECKHYTIADGLISNNVNCLFQDKKGNIWIGTRDAGVSSFDGKEFTNYTEQDGLSSSPINAINENQEGNIVFGTQKGLFIFDGKNLLKENRYPDMPVFAIAVDNQNTIWLGTTLGVKYFDKNDNKFLSLEEVNDQVWDIQIGKNNRIWIGTHEGYLYCADKLSVTTYLIEEENFLKKLLINKNGEIWIGTQNGIFKFSSKTAKVKQIHGARGSNLMSIVEDKSGNLWFASGNEGIERLEGETFFQYNFPEKVLFTYKSPILNDKGNKLWVSTQDGLLIYSNQHFYRQDTQHGLPPNRVKYIIQDFSDQYWCNTSAGFVNFDKKNISHWYYDYAHGTMKEDSKHNIWFVNDAGIGFFNPKEEKFIDFIPAQAKLSNALEDVSVIIEDTYGQYWIGTYQKGLIRFDGEKFTHFTEENGLADNFARTVIKDRFGNLWVTSIPNGLSIIKSASLQKNQLDIYYITEKNGLLNNNVRALIEDSYGYIWAGTDAGISRIKNEENLWAKENIEIQNYNSHKNFKNLLSAHSFGEDKNGDIWFISENNESPISEFLTRYHRMADTINPFPPQIHITAVKLHNQSVNWNNLTPEQKNWGTSFDSIDQWHHIPYDLELPYHQNTITFTFIGIALKNPKYVKYQWKIKELDKQWSTPTTSSEITYSGLRTILFPKNYTFMVKAANEDGIWSQPISYSFKISPPWWKSIWACLVYGFLVGFFIYSFIQFRVRQKLRLEKIKREEREKIKQQLSRDYHDEFGADITKILLSTQILKSTTIQNSHLLELIITNTQKLKLGLKEFTWLINPHKDNLFQLMVKLQEEGKKLFEDTPIRFQLVDLNATFEAIFISAEKRKEIFRLFKEAMNNCLKYSECQTAILGIDCIKNEKTVIISFQDDGKGFDPETVNHINGITNMETRGKKIGGKLKVITAIGKGTQILLEVDTARLK